MSHDNSAPLPSSERAISEDDRERIASIKRCLPHMVGKVRGDVGAIWPRDVEFMLALIDRLVPSPGDKGSDK